MEICSAFPKGVWGYQANAVDINAADVMDRLAEAARGRANLLINTGPLPDGSIFPQDSATLREIGLRLRANGFPEASAAEREAGKEGGEAMNRIGFYLGLLPVDRRRNATATGLKKQPATNEESSRNTCKMSSQSKHA